LGVGALAVATAGYVASVDPHDPGHYPPCPFLMVTGWYCPACGGLRALHELLHARASDALSLNLYLVLGLPVVVVWWIGWLLGRSSSEGPVRPPAVPRPVVGGVVALGLIFTVMRNLPGSPWLAP
jgi:hypothetical protein